MVAPYSFESWSFLLLQFEKGPYTSVGPGHEGLRLKHVRSGLLCLLVFLILQITCVDDWKIGNHCWTLKISNFKRFLPPFAYEILFTVLAIRRVLHKQLWCFRYAFSLTRVSLNFTFWQSGYIQATLWFPCPIVPLSIANFGNSLISDVCSVYSFCVIIRDICLLGSLSYREPFFMNETYKLSPLSICYLCVLSHHLSQSLLL